MQILRTYLYTSLLISIIAVVAMGAVPPSTRSQSANLSGTINGFTSQGQRITIMVRNNIITLLNVGLHIQGGGCSSFYTSVHQGNLGTVTYNQFHIVIEDENEWISVKGSFGEQITGRIDFATKPGLENVCQGSLTVGWRTWQPMSDFIPPTPTPLPTPVPFPTPTPLPTSPAIGRSPFEKYTVNDVIAAFEEAGLEVVNPTSMTPADYGNVPMVATEAASFSIPSVGAQVKGRVFSFDTPGNRDYVATYYQNQNLGKGGFVAWVYSHDNILVQLDGDVPANLASRYQGVLMAMDYSSAVTPQPTPAVNPFGAP